MIDLYDSLPGNRKTGGDQNIDLSSLLLSARTHLAEINALLDQMLALAQEAARDGDDIDRPAIPRELERLRDQIDLLADKL